MKQVALTYYLDSNYSIIPLGPDKRPALSSWTKYQTEHADENQINEWWKANPLANIGIVTGAISGITVVDLDTSKMSPDAQTTLEQFPSTYTVRTQSGGYHLYYKHDPSISQTANTYPQYPHLDIRNDGGYVVAPPSIGTKGAYTVLKDIPLAQFPTELFNPTNAPTTKKKRTLQSLMAVQEGNGGNSAMTSLVGKLLAKWKPSEWDKEVWPAILIINASYKPPFSVKELTTIYDSICKKETKRLAGLENLDPTNPNDAEEKEIVQQFIKSKKKGTYQLAQYITNKYRIITVGEVEKEIYVYRDGMYARAENEVIYPEVQRVLKDNVDKSAKLEVLHKISDATFKNRSIFKSAPVNLIPLKNGVFDVYTKELLPHSHEYCFTFQFPITYNPEAKAPQCEAFMRQVLNDEQFQTVQEWIGYYFHRLYSYKKAIIFVGEGDTGKTTLLEMITNLLGRENISSVSLQKMTGDKFAGAHLYEKHGNIVDELSAKDIHDTGQFKTATGGGSINGEYKFGNQFSFLNYAKLTFACNKIPDVKEMDDVAYFNRWMIIRFEKHITKKIPNFIERLTTEEERSGLFNFAMVGLKRLLANGSFTYAKSGIDTKLEMLRSGSSIAQFVSARIFKSIDNEISKDTMYQHYVDYCNELSLDTDSMDNFGKKFSDYVPYVSDGRITDTEELDSKGRPKRARGWRNVDVKKSAEEEAKEKASEEELQSLAQHLNG